MKVTIVVQRASIVLGCMLWMLLFWSPLAAAKHPEAGAHTIPASVVQYVSKDMIIAFIIFLAVIERMCAVGNNLVMERDWVPTIASEVTRPPLHQLNAIMRRIDLISKILAPVVMSVIAIKTSSAVLALITAGINVGTVGVELIAAKTAWNKCNILKLAREPKDDQPILAATGEQGILSRNLPDPERKTGLRLYFSNDVWMGMCFISSRCAIANTIAASLSVALQSFSVLSLSGPMTTYLLTRHYSLSLITTARTAISVVEIGSTVVFPMAAYMLARYPFRWLPDPMSVLGLSGVTSQLLLLVPCVVALLAVPTDSLDPASDFPIYTVLIFIFLGLSRLGHWTHNMAVQQIAQTRVPAAQRVEYSGVEMAFVSAAEIGRWASSAIWHSPSQFKGVALGGLGSVIAIWLLFAAWALKSRRNLVVRPSSRSS
jgi:iron-regulated transporter 1